MTEMPMTETMMSSETSSARSVTPDELDKKFQKKIINWVNTQFDRAKSDRWKDERQWYLNLAFYFGKQNIQVADVPGSSRQFKLYVPPAPYYRARPVINRIRPLLRTEMAKLTAQKPSAYIVPASNDERDLFAASAGEQLWETVQRDKNLRSKIRQQVFWSSVTGNGFLKAWWDDDKVDVANNTMGDICYEVITPFHIFVPDLRESAIEAQPWVIHAANKPIDQLEMTYGKPLSKAKNATGDILDESFSTAMNVNTDSKKKDSTLVLEAWIKPGAIPMFSEGGVVTIAGDEILSFTEGQPYEHNKYPFSHLRHIETGKFYGESTVVDLIPLQREFNRTRGQIIEAKNRMAKPQLAAEIGSIDPGKVTTEPGQIVMYRPGFNPPTPIPLQGLPSYVLQELDRIQLDMNEISGQHEVSRGGVPSGVTAATAISFLQEQDDTKLAFTYASLEENYEKIAFMTLCYIKQYWDTEHMVKVTGPDGSFDVMAFQGSDLRDNTDVHIEGGSALPTSRAAKQAFILDLMKMGFIDPTKGLEVMEIGGVNKIYESLQVDTRQAQRENLKMAQVTDELQMQHTQETMAKLLEDPQAQMLMQAGELQFDPETQQLSAGGVPFDMPLIVPVNDWDNHRLHIAKHNDYRKSQAYETLPEVAKRAFEEHVNQHVHAIMVGASGAMGLDPEALAMADNPETFQEMSAQGMPIPGEESPSPEGNVPAPSETSPSGSEM
jgi:hypothetical protein